MLVVTGRWFRGTPRREIIGNVEVNRTQTLWEFFGIKGLRTLGGYLFMASLALWMVRNRHRYDVVHIHGMNYHSATAVWVAHRLGKPTVTKIANSAEASDLNKMRGSRQLRGARHMVGQALRSDRFVALNELVASDLRDEGVGEDRIVSIPNGVDLPRSIRCRPCDPARLSVVYVGRLHAQKCLHTLVEAVARCEQRSPRQVKAVLVGDGPARVELERQTCDLGVDALVEFTGQTDDVASVLDESDVFVLPSSVEGLSNALLEAMARGLPAVVSDIAANTSVVTDSLDGRHFPLGDAETLASCLLELQSDAPQRRRLGAAAKRTVGDSYSLDSVASAYEALYVDIGGDSR